MNKWIGKKLYGYCDGAFGTKSYNNKIIEAIGKDWVVAREEPFDEVVIAQFYEGEFDTLEEAIESFLSKWSKEEIDEDEDEVFYPEIPLATIEELKEEITQYKKVQG